MVNMAEFIAGSSPTDADDFFSITSVNPFEADTNADVPAITWRSVTGRVYRVYVSSNILAQWPTGSVHQTWGDGTVRSYAVTNNPKGGYIRLGVGLQ